VLLIAALTGATGILATSDPALAATPTVSVTPPSLSLVGMRVHVAGFAQTVTVTNTGSVPVLMNGTGQPCGTSVPCIAGANAADFNVTSNTCQHATIPVGQSCAFAVTYVPSRATPESADVYIGDNATGSPQMVPLTGRLYQYVRTSIGVFKAVTSVPLSIFNTVGITSPIPVTRLSVLHHQPPFRYGKLAGSFFWGAEYCPYCAATRWGLIVALSRFGHFNKLYDMTSSATDVSPNSPTFTFFMTKYTSPFLVFNGYEVEGPTMAPHMTTPPSITRLVRKYNTYQAFPFLDIGNTAFLASSAWNPAYISGQSRNAIAAGLRTPSLRLTKAIVAEANYISSGICAVDGELPARVCTSSGVVKADTVQHLAR